MINSLLSLLKFLRYDEIDDNFSKLESMICDMINSKYDPYNKHNYFNIIEENKEITIERSMRPVWDIVSGRKYYTPFINELDKYGILIGASIEKILKSWSD